MHAAQQDEGVRTGHGDALAGGGDDALLFPRGQQAHTHTSAIDSAAAIEVAG